MLAMATCLAFPGTLHCAGMGKAAGGVFAWT